MKYLLSKMATFVEFLMSCVSQYFILITGVTAIAAFYILSTATQAFGRKNQESKMDRNSCSSPTCLRCSRRGCKKEELLMKLQDFECTRNTSQGDLTRIHEAIKNNVTPTTAQQPSVFYLDKLTPQVAWHDGSYNKSELELLTSPENFQVIKSEFIDLYMHHSECWIRNSVSSGTWHVSHLYNQGKKIDKNCARCPTTTKILESVVPFARACAFGNAIFSVMEAGTHITAHYGPTNCRLRCHLPLVVPEGCGLKVNTDQRAWKEGQPLIFDDSFLHEAWHRGTHGYRAVLMLDLWHPGLSETEQDALGSLFPLLG